ncbi:MAG: hypothetical protein KGV43_03675 [Arcobacter sp.]|nr:hypothetical protein [Arcobacter sp.]
MRKIFKILIVFGFVFMCFLGFKPMQNVFNNGISLIFRNGFFIPKESFIYSFVEMQKDEGSGEYWLYAQDDRYYYTTMTKDKKYIKISKQLTKSKKDFDKLNVNTWK